MADIDGMDAFMALLNRLEEAAGDRHEIKLALLKSEADLYDVRCEAANLRAENEQLRVHRVEPVPTIMEPPCDTAGVLSPHVRGRCAFKDHRSHRVPADLLHDQSAAQEYVAGWTEAKAEAEAAPATAPADDSIPF